MNELKLYKTTTTSHNHKTHVFFHSWEFRVDVCSCSAPKMSSEEEKLGERKEEGSLHLVQVITPGNNTIRNQLCDL